MVYRDNVIKCPKFYDRLEQFVCVAKPNPGHIEASDTTGNMNCQHVLTDENGREVIYNGERYFTSGKLRLVEVTETTYEDEK